MISFPDHLNQPDLSLKSSQDWSGSATNKSFCKKLLKVPVNTV